MLKKIFGLLVSLFLLIFLTSFAFAQNEVNLYLFWSKTCPHCKDEISFLQKTAPDYPNLKIHTFEITENRDNSLLLQKIGQKLNTDINSVPTTFIGDDFFSGYFSDEISGSQIINLVKKYSEEGDPDLVGKIIDSQEKPTPSVNSKNGEKNQDFYGNLPDRIKIPFVGEIVFKNLSLPVLTLVIALVDGFNPCAMWVLLFLISLLLGMKDRAKMWILGSVFIAASGFVYFLFLAAWLNLVLFLGFISWVRILIGIVAIVMGIYQLRDYLKNKDAVCKVTGGEKRKKVFEKLKEITSKRNFILALLGIILLAFAVNLVELVCSAGLPAIYTQVLSLTPMPRWQYYLYLTFYILIFMLDDMVVFAIAMVTLKAVGIESKYARFSRLIGGLVILAIGILMLFKPEFLMFGS